MSTRPPLPPFPRDTAIQKVRQALIKELWAYDGNRIAVRFRAQISLAAWEPPGWASGTQRSRALSRDTATLSR